MKKFCFSLMTAAISLMSAGCFFYHEPVGVPGKEVILPAKAGKKSFPVGGFIAIGDRWASEQTEVFAERIDDKIKFEIVCYGKTSDLEWSDKKPDDDMTLFGGEHVELLIAPFGLNEDGIYYHFALNPAGSVYHAKRHDTEWNLDNVCKTEILEDRWVATFEIPVMAMTLDKTGKTGNMWNVNFCRTIKKKGKEAEHTSWTGSSNFHDITTMGQLHFNKAPLADQLRIFQCKADAFGQLELNIRKAGKDHAYLQIYESGKYLTTMKLDGADSIEKTVRLKDDYVSLKGTKELSLYLLGPYRVPIQDFSANLVMYEKDFLVLDKMEYINTDEMTCNVLLSPGVAVIKNDTKEVRKQEISDKTGKISLKDLEPGRYVLEYTSCGKRSSRVFFITKEHKVPAELPAERKFTAKGKDLLLNGQPFFLLGISGGFKAHFPVNPGFTLAYGSGARKNAPAYKGIPGRRLVRKPVTGYAFTKNWEEQVQKHMDNLGKSKKGDWNLLCYEATLAVLHPDEKGNPEVDPKGYKIYKKIYRMAKKAAPEEIFAIQIDDLTKVEDYVDSCDVLEYASGRSSYNQTNMIDKLGEDFDFVRSVAKKKPLVLWLGGTIPNPVCRSAEEIRAGVYYTILKGGVGNIIHMGHTGMSATRTRFWSMLSMLPGEIDSFYADLKTWKETEIKLPKNLIGKAVAGPEGQLLLVVLNTSLREIQAEIELPGFEKEKLTFTPLEPRVIRKVKEVPEKKK